MKELQAFYNITEIAEKEGINLDQIYQEFTNLLPQSWQFPEIACARIVIGDSEFRTTNFAESIWMQSAPVKVNGSVVGKIDVSYLGEMPELDEGPFMREERQLINGIAERLGHITERKRAEKALKESHDQLEWLFDVLPVGISVLDRDSQLVKSNPTLEETLAISKEGLLRGDFRKRRYFRPDGTLMPSEEFASTRVENGEKSVYHVETGVEKEDGSISWLTRPGLLTRMHLG
jgi:PAS domain-containing protein